MSYHDHDYPWLFRRDEVDLLEDELDDLYALYADDDKGQPMSEEAEILQEQIQTEEQSDAELTLRLGVGMLHGECHEHSQAWQASPQEHEHDDDDAVTLSIRRHPLYQRSRVWAAELRLFAKERFERDDVYRAAFFRVYVNVNLVPIKIFTALCEETHDDCVGQLIAEEAYLLSLTYLERIADSLSLVLHTMDEFEVIKRIQAQGEILRTGIIQQLTVLRRRNVRL